MPSRNGSVTARCVVCDGRLPAGRKRTTCSDSCRQAAWRRRHQPEWTPPALPPARPRKPVTVYESDACGTRLLGHQQCDCVSRAFMRRVDTGGTCPCCSEPVSFDELLNG